MQIFTVICVSNTSLKQAEAHSCCFSIWSASAGRASLTSLPTVSPRPYPLFLPIKVGDESIEGAARSGLENQEWRFKQAERRSKRESNKITAKRWQPCEIYSSGFCLLVAGLAGVWKSCSACEVYLFKLVEEVLLVAGISNTALCRKEKKKRDVFNI